MAKRLNKKSLRRIRGGTEQHLYPDPTWPPVRANKQKDKSKK